MPSGARRAASRKLRVSGGRLDEAPGQRKFQFDAARQQPPDPPFHPGTRQPGGLFRRDERTGSPAELELDLHLPHERWSGDCRLHRRIRRRLRLAPSGTDAASGLAFLRCFRAGFAAPDGVRGAKNCATRAAALRCFRRKSIAMTLRFSQMLQVR